uniref:Synaptobrevin, longin-like domain protein n=1 Tax=Tanacetum cinerariifolium TaxID=118510 RepID=A0A6L2NJH3_TANCI|nr:hypothetical protein [Tanacetum cinerariifolium]
MALGKDKSNPFMAGSLPKTIWHFLTVVRYKLMLFGLMKDVVHLMLLATATIKKVNDAVHLRALIDGKNVVVSKDVIRSDLRLDDADGVECLPNEEIFAELARMGYEKPPPKLTFYKAFFSVQWKFLIYTLVQCVSAKRTVWNEFSCSMASAVICLATGRKFNFSKYIFDSMEQPTATSKSSMYLLNTLMATCATLSQKVAELKQDKHTQALEILKLKKRVKSLEKKKSKSLGFKRLRKGRINQDVSAATKDVSAAEPTVFDDEEVTMTMAQTLIKMKAEKERLLDEKLLKENIDWNAIAEQIQEKHLDNIKNYQSLKTKPVSIAQARKNMVIYLKNMAGYKMEHFRDVEEPKKKRVPEETLLQESFKKLKAVEVSGSETTQEVPSNDPKEMSEEDIIRVGEITEAYQCFEDMLKGSKREYLVALWNLVKEKFNSAVPREDKEKSLWVELKRLFEPNADDVFCKLQRYMHDPLTWKLYTNCGVHHVSLKRRHDIFMLTEKDYPLSDAVMILMLSTKLQVEEDCEIARDLVMKIFMEANKPKSKSVDTSSN